MHGSWWEKSGVFRLQESMRSEINLYVSVCSSSPCVHTALSNTFAFILKMQLLCVTKKLPAIKKWSERCPKLTVVNILFHLSFSSTLCGHLLENETFHIHLFALCAQLRRTLTGEDSATSKSEDFKVCHILHFPHSALPGDGHSPTLCVTVSSIQCLLVFFYSTLLQMFNLIALMSVKNYSESQKSSKEVVLRHPCRRQMSWDKLQRRLNWKLQCFIESVPTSDE